MYLLRVRAISHSGRELANLHSGRKVANLHSGRKAAKCIERYTSALINLIAARTGTIRLLVKTATETDTLDARGFGIGQKLAAKTA